MRRFLTAVALAGSAGATLARAQSASPATRTAITTELKQMLDSLLQSDSTTPGLALHVESPRYGLSWTGTAGVADRATRAPLGPTHAFRMASNTKTYVAAAVLKLWESGKIRLDAPIGSYLSPATIATLKRGGYDPSVITVRHLLTHTSGIFDWGDLPEYGERIQANPKYRWSRAEQLALAVDRGKPYGRPGEFFRYSDTGYNLLGEIIERVTGKSWAPALRQTIGFSGIGLNETWLESLEPAPVGVAGRAHQYIGPVDTYDWDPSLDLWGGGGYVATMRDMARFTRGLFTGMVYQTRTTKDSMLTTVPAKEGPAYRGGGSRIAKQGNYRMGIAVVDYAGMPTYVHSGFWGTFSLYVPHWDLSIAGVQTQQQSRLLGALMTGSVAVLKRHLGGLPEQAWNPEGSYEWKMDLSGILMNGGFTVYRRPDGTFGSHGNLGGPTGEALLGKSVKYERNVLDLAFEAASGEILIRVGYDEGKYTGRLTLGGLGVAADITVEKTGN